MNSTLKQAKMHVDKLKKVNESINDGGIVILLDFSREEGVQDIRFRIPVKATKYQARDFRKNLHHNTPFFNMD